MPPKVLPEKQTSKEVEEKKDNLKYQCTACEEYITTSFQAYLHPLLKCLICRKCHTEYKTGDFAEDFDEGVDEEGIDNYCRWCVDGGDLFACSNQDKQTDRCTHVFCDKCVARNVPDDPLLQLDNQPEGFKWLCYVCNPAPLKDLRKQAAQAILTLSQRDLQRQKESVTTTSQGPVNSNQKGDKPVSSNGAGSNRKNSEITPSSKSPAAEVSSKKDDKVATSSTKTTEKNLDESGSERKKRRTEAATGSSSSTAPEPERRESLTRKEKDKKKDEEAARDPESIRLPPLEKPKQAVSALRNLARPSLLPSSRSHTIPPSTTSRKSTAPQSSSATRPPPASSGNSISRPSLPTSAKIGFIPHGPSARQAAQDNRPSTTQSSANAKTVGPSTAAASTAAASTAAASVTTTCTPPVTPTTTASAVVIPSSATVTTNPVAKPKPSNVSKAVENVDLGRSSVPPGSVSSAPIVKLKAHSKGLKPNNDQVKHASTKVKLTEQDLVARLENLCSVKNKCVQEIDIKIQSICEMFKTKDLTHRTIIKREIEDLKAPLQEFQTMLVNFESLYASQS